MNTNRKSSPRSSPGRINHDLINGTNNENLPSNDGMGTHDETNVGGLTSSMINGVSTASMPIPYQRMQNNTHQHQHQQQQQQQQQQMLLYQQQQV
jgi:hypothetical protein